MRRNITLALGFSQGRHVAEYLAWALDFGQVKLGQLAAENRAA